MKAFRISSILTCSAVALALVSAAPAALANTLTVSGTIAPAFTNFTGSTGSVAQFNSSLGTLTSVEITLNGGGTTIITAAATTSSPTVFTALSTSLDLLLTDPTDSNVNTLQALSGGPVVNAFNPITVVEGSPYSSGSDPLSGLAGSQTLTSDLSSFIGSGDIEFLLAGDASTTESFSGGDFNAGQTTDAGAGIIVTYTFTNPNPSAVPEPGTLILFGTGLLLMAGLVRRKFHQSR